MDNLGWREWICLPELNIPYIKAKVDTGARTSVLHAFSVEPTKEHNEWVVRFKVHPMQRREDIVAVCRAPIVDYRWVTDSGGHREKRYVISTQFQVGSIQWLAEMTLTNRDNMKFRMLLGRSAIKGRYLVNSGKSYLSGNKPE